MGLMELYSTNEDFKTYVDRYIQRESITVTEALTHYMVREYATYLLAIPKKVR